jgi:hypothetical protein
VHILLETGGLSIRPSVRSRVLLFPRSVQDSRNWIVLRLLWLAGNVKDTERDLAFAAKEIAFPLEATRSLEPELVFVELEMLELVLVESVLVESDVLLEWKTPVLRATSSRCRLE